MRLREYRRTFKSLGMEEEWHYTKQMQFSLIKDSIGMDGSPLRKIQRFFAKRNSKHTFPSIISAGSSVLGVAGTGADHFNAPHKCNPVGHVVSKKLMHPQRSVHHRIFTEWARLKLGHLVAFHRDRPMIENIHSRNFTRSFCTHHMVNHLIG
jgi:hypothetical protein